MSKAMLLVATVGLLGACGSEDRQAPTTADFVIEKAPESGDKQVGVAAVPVGGIVNWFWPVGSAGHNIVPDA